MGYLVGMNVEEEEEEMKSLLSETRSTTEKHL